jgi:hypothetical protein
VWTNGSWLNHVNTIYSIGKIKNKFSLLNRHGDYNEFKHLNDLDGRIGLIRWRGVIPCPERGKNAGSEKIPLDTPLWRSV